MSALLTTKELASLILWQAHLVPTTNPNPMGAVTSHQAPAGAAATGKNSKNHDSFDSTPLNRSVRKHTVIRRVKTQMWRALAKIGSNVAVGGISYSENSVNTVRASDSHPSGSRKQCPNFFATPQKLATTEHGVDRLPSLS